MPYLQVLSNCKNHVEGSLPFFSMYANRVLEITTKKKRGGGGYTFKSLTAYIGQPTIMKYLCITSTTAFVPLGMFPENKYALANSPCTRAAYSLVYPHTHTHTHTQPMGSDIVGCLFDVMHKTHLVLETI